jgi:single-strand DNA-binding protein
MPERRCHVPVNPNASGVHVMPNLTVNRLNCAGPLTRNAERHCLASGTPVAGIGMAVKNRMKKGNEWHDDPTRIDVIGFGKLAETMGADVDTGHNIVVSGRLQFRSWEEKKGGGKRRKREIVADCIRQAGSSGQEARSREPGEEPVDSDAPFELSSGQASATIPARRRPTVHRPSSGGEKPVGSWRLTSSGWVTMCAKILPLEVRSAQPRVQVFGNLNRSRRAAAGDGSHSQRRRRGDVDSPIPAVGSRAIPCGPRCQKSPHEASRTGSTQTWPRPP